MATLFRKTVTRQLPNGAEIIVRGGRRIARWKDRRGKTQTAPLTGGKNSRDRIRTKSRTVYAKLRIDGEVKEIPTGCRTEDAARNVLSELVRRAEHIKARILTAAEARTADHQTTSLAEHVRAYIEHLRAKGVTPGRVKQTESRLLRVANECGWRLLADLSAGGLESWLATKRDAGDMSAANWNAHRSAWVAFGNWCKRKTVGRLASNPFADVPPANEKADPRRRRRAMTEAELVRLLKVAWLRPLAEFGRETVERDDTDKRTDKRSRATWTKAPLMFVMLDAAAERGREALAKRTGYVAELEHRGRERALLYRTLVLTGLRRAELASLTVGQCELAGPTPHVTLNAADEKNREGNSVPLRADLAADLSWHLVERLRDAQRAAKRDSRPIPARLSATAPLIHVPSGLVRILNRDLAAAGIPKRDDRGRTLDVHALRTTFGSLLSRAGVPLRTAQAAMRHSDPSLTANVYTDPRLLDVAGAMNSLPGLPLDDLPNAERAKATGTYAQSFVAPTVAPNVGNQGQTLGSGDRPGSVTVTQRGGLGGAASLDSVDGKQELASVDDVGQNGRYRTRTGGQNTGKNRLFGPRRCRIRCTCCRIVPD